MKVASLVKLPLILIVAAVVLYFAYGGAKYQWEKYRRGGNAPLSAQKGRFQRMDGVSVDLAFDNWTGQICKTWKWDEKARPELKTYAGAPLCASLTQAEAENKGQ